MRSAITAIQMAIRAAFVVQLALGLAFWTGNALGLVDLHQLIGILIVIGLWTQAVLAARAGVQPGMVAAAAVWGLVVIVVGLTQRDLLPGPPVGHGHGLDRRASVGRHVDVLDGQPTERAGEGEDAVPERGARVEEDEGPAVDHAQAARAGGRRLEQLDADGHPELLGNARQLGEQRGIIHRLGLSRVCIPPRRRPPPTPAAGSG